MSLITTKSCTSYSRCYNNTCAPDVNDCVKTNSDQMECDQPSDENSMDSSDQSEFSDEYYTKKLRKMNKEDRRDNDKLRRQVNVN